MIQRKEYQILLKRLLNTGGGLDALIEIIEVPPAPAERSGEAKQEKKADNPGPRMTENQKRFMFRLLAAQKVEGKEAEEHLKKYFQVTNLSDIPKDSASRYIDELVADQKKGTGS